MLPRIRRLFGSASSPARRDRLRQRFRPQVEALEERLTPTTYTPTTTTDFAIANAASVNSSNGQILSGPGMNQVTLRSAVIAANASGGGTITFNQAVGTTYTLTIAPVLTNTGGVLDKTAHDAVTGSLDVLHALTVTGNGAANTIIQAGTTSSNGIDQIFDINPFPPAANGFAVSITGVTLQNGKNASNDPGADGEGGAIDFDAGTNSNGSLTLTNDVITHNQTTNGDGGGLALFDGGTVSISGCTISNNTANNTTTGFAVLGGGIYVGFSGTVGTLTLSNNTIIDHNQDADTSVGSSGGGIDASQGGLAVVIHGGQITNNSTHDAGGGLTAGQFTIDQGTLIDSNSAGTQGGGVFGKGSITNATITNNSAGTGGGAVFATGTTTITGNRIVGNTATAVDKSAGTVTANGNWWGTNAGPSGFVAAGVTANNWLDLVLSPGSGSIQTNSSTALNAKIVSATSNMVGTTAVTGTVLEGLNVTFAVGASPPTGSSVSPTTVAISNGTASSTFFSGSGEGTAHPSVALDNQTTTTAITIARPATTVVSINRDSATPTNASSLSWDVTFATAVSGLSASNFTLVKTGLGGTPAISTVTPTSGSHTTFTVTASTGTGSGTLGLNLTNDTGLDHSLSNLPFTGQVYTIDRSAPTVTTNNGLTVSSGGSGIIGSSQLAATDPDDTAANITYTVTAGPSHGSVQLNGVAATTFTQADINNNHVSYVNTATGFSSDSFTFSVMDALGNTTTGQTFNITITQQQQATVTGVTIGWGTPGQTSGTLVDNGTTLLPAGRNIDIPWLNVNKINITLSSAATLTPGDVTVTGKTVANYGPVTISGSGTSYTITLAKPISAADRVTVTVGNSGITTYTRRLDVLPGDFLDKGVVDAANMLAVYYATAQPYKIFADIDGDGVVGINDVMATRNRIGTRLPPP